jgi:hypothetical protein
VIGAILRGCSASLLILRDPITRFWRMAFLQESAIFGTEQYEPQAGIFFFV